MKSKITFLAALLFFVNDAVGQIGRLALSPFQRTELKIGLTDIALEFSRPSMRGREIFGELVPYNKLWRTGANRNSTIQFSEDIILNGQRIESGKYAIFTTPSEKQWEVMLYADTDNWDVPAVVDSSKIVGRITVEAKQLINEHETLSITIEDFTNHMFNLNIRWSDIYVTIPIQLTNRELMDNKINRILGGPSYNDYYAAAEYQMESGKDFEKGLAWINKAIELTEEVTWWDMRIKAILLMELGEKEEARKLAKQGLAEATAEKRAYGINQFNGILKKLE